jgi:hypothetical protein
MKKYPFSSKELANALDKAGHKRLTGTCECSHSMDSHLDTPFYSVNCSECSCPRYEES